ncbi:D-alanyl-D-alanine carboxypeptidase/D-alanyl-D-alanine-endopeptidase [bacterium]|nr:D-alanyl-D-alanine carboxypeptidase/D-alanyl-D-alanine-endopeptidase [bacterium]
MRKILSLILGFALTVTVCNAESISKTLSNLGVNKSAVSVSIIDVKSGKVIYELNEKVPRLPASTLKILTSSAAVDALGSDYELKTQFYKSVNNDVYLKLSGDPLLTEKNLEQLMAAAAAKNIEPKTFYIDDSIFDNVQWGDGWQWDDALNPLMPKFAAYNVNGNVTTVTVNPTSNGAVADVYAKPFYPYLFMVSAVTNFKAASEVTFSKFNEPSDVFSEEARKNMLVVSGQVSKTVSKTIPVLNPAINFTLRLKSAISAGKFQYYGSFKRAKLPTENVYLIDEVSRDLGTILNKILKTSDNLAAESLFKHAGAIWSDSEGSIENSIKMTDLYLKNIKISAEDIKIVDGSGVSKNNLMTSDFMANFLLYKAGEDDFETFKNYLPTPGEGTLKNRMLYFKDNLRAKTGTLSEASAIAGYITSRRGKLYAFDIMINDAKTSPADKKNIEEQILRNVYLNH